MRLKIYNRCNKNCLKRAIQKTAEETGDLNGRKIADKITNVSEKLPNDKTEADAERATNKKR